MENVNLNTRFEEPYYMAHRSASLPINFGRQVFNEPQNSDHNLDPKRVKLTPEQNGCDSITPPSTPPATPFRLDSSTPCKSLTKSISIFKNTQEQILEKQIIKFGNEVFSLGKKFHGGSYMDVYPLINTAGESHYVIKLFKDTHLKRHASVLKSYLENAIKNYETLKEAGFSVATIINIKTASQDGYYIQKIVSHSIDLNNDEHLKQVNAFFVYAQKEDVVCDLHPGNFGIDDKGNVTLFDFVEDPEDGLEVFMNRDLRLWRERLTKDSSDPSWFDQKYKIITNNLQIKEYDGQD